jgi:hypothetical protein
MPAVGFIGGDGVRGAGGEEGVEPVGVEDGPLSGTGVRVQVRDPADHQAPGDAFALFAGAERGERCFGDFGGADPPVRGFVEDRVGVLDRLPCVLGDSRKPS